MDWCWRHYHWLGTHWRIVYNRLSIWQGAKYAQNQEGEPNNWNEQCTCSNQSNHFGLYEQLAACVIFGLVLLMKWNDNNNISWCKNTYDTQAAHRAAASSWHNMDVLNVLCNKQTHRSMVLINKDDRLYWCWIYMRRIVTLHRSIATTRHRMQQITQNSGSYGSRHHFYQCCSCEQYWYTSILSSWLIMGH